MNISLARATFGAADNTFRFQRWPGLATIATSAPPLAPLAPEPPLSSIKERALAEAARATGEAESEYGGMGVAPESFVVPEPAPAGEYDPEC